MYTIIIEMPYGRKKSPGLVVLAAVSSRAMENPTDASGLTEFVSLG